MVGLGVVHYPVFRRASGVRYAALQAALFQSSGFSVLWSIMLWITSDFGAGVKYSVKESVLRVSGKYLNICFVLIK